MIRSSAAVTSRFDKSNIGLIARRPGFYPTLVKHVTLERVKERFELPNLNALNFLLHDTLDGGGTLSLRADPQGKTIGTALLCVEIDLEDTQ